MTDWLAIGRSGPAARAFRMSGTELVQQAEGPDEAAARAALGADAPDIVIRVGEGRPEALPTALLPKRGQTVPGLLQERPADAIGAWVQLWIAGFLRLNDGWDGVLCATELGVSHWIQVSAGEAVSSQSFLTPRLVEALDGAPEPDADALADSLSRPARLASYLRSAEVSADARAMTGYLFGAELAAARPYWLGQQVAVLAPPPAALAAALKEQGVPTVAHDPETLVAPGLAALGAAFGFTR